MYLCDYRLDLLDAKVDESEDDGKWGGQGTGEVKIPSLLVKSLR